MIEIVGDFWSVAKDYDALVCTTNCELDTKGKLIMGAGIALQFKKRFIGIDRMFGNILASQSDPFMYIRYDCFNSVFHQKFLIAFPTKREWRNNSNLTIIEDSLKKLIELTNDLGFKNVLTTRFGCGLGNLSWDDQVKPLVLKYLDDRFYVINK